MSTSNQLGEPSIGRYTIKNKLSDAAYFLGQLNSLRKISVNTDSSKSRDDETPRVIQGGTDLANLFNIYGSDKSTHHDYHLLYDELLGHKRYEIKNIVEIGIGSIDLATPQNMGLNGFPGGSLRAFRDWAPSAEIIGADIDEKTLFEEDRIRTCTVNQLDRTSFNRLREFIPNYADLIVIDGLHTPRADMNSLLELLPKLRLGGCFVIEDISPRAAKMLWPFAKSVLKHKYLASIRNMKNGYVFVLIPCKR